MWSKDVVATCRPKGCTLMPPNLARWPRSRARGSSARKSQMQASPSAPHVAMNDESGAQLTPVHLSECALTLFMHSHFAASQIFTDPDQPPVHTKFCVGALRTDATGRASAAWDWARASDRNFAKVPAAASLSASAAAASSRWRRCSARRRRARSNVPGARARRAPTSSRDAAE